MNPLFSPTQIAGLEAFGERFSAVDGSQAEMFDGEIQWLMGDHPASSCDDHWWVTSGNFTQPLKMAIEIVSSPMKNPDVQKLC